MIQGLFKHIVSDEQNTFLQEKHVHSNLYARVRILKGVCNATNHFDTEKKTITSHLYIGCNCSTHDQLPTFNDRWFSEL